MKAAIGVVGCVVAGSLLAFGGCGGNTSSPGGSSADGSAVNEAGSSSGTSGSSGQAVACPSAPPSGTCPKPGLECEYGDDPRPTCRTIATCEGSTWSVAAPKCEILPAATCPASPAAASGQTCTPTNAVCNYDGTVCECTNCIEYPIERCEGPVTWRCEAPPTEAGCPAGRPRLGTTCSQNGKLCVYGCEPGLSRECKTGHWGSASSPGGCPVSTAKAKTDIRYLSEDDLGSLASDARALRLARWRYRGSLDDGRSHVGYILEDAPSSPSSDMKREQVDLYAYTSMTLALAQQQARRIEKLEKEVRDLERRCGR